MREYNIGDQFLITITDIDKTGMGTVVVCDRILRLDLTELGMLERFYPDKPETKEKEPKEYSVEELENKVVSLASLLSRSITQLDELKRNLKNTNDVLDDAINSV